jgi:hypothetical protein
MSRLLSIRAVTVLVSCALVAAPAAQSGVSGDWELTFNTDQGQIIASLALKQSGDELSGTLTSPQGEAPIKGSVEGSNLKWTMDFSGPQGSITIDFVAEVAGQAMKGEASFGQGSFVFYGKKK